MADLDALDTIIVVMMENRSFDHMLGHLSLPAFDGRDDVNGLEGELTDDGRLENEAYRNPAEGTEYYPFQFEEDRTLLGDVPHDRGEVATQIGIERRMGGSYPMNGFVEAHWEYQERERTTRPNTMGFFGPTQVPMTRFLANNFCVCDRWFSSLPTSTQPNKLMALAGDSTIDSTKPRLIEDVPLVLEWLEERNVSWRVYHDGLPFFLFFGPDMVLDAPNFRPFEEFHRDLANESAEEFPDVVFLEPMYQSSPHLDDDVPNDNHAPLPVRNGEYFLREIYSSLTDNEDIWSSSLLIYSYDEHGGFWDHVSPPQLGYEPPADAEEGFSEPFECLGPRVPGILISPFVEPGSVFSELLDHTTLLELIAAKFGEDDQPYSDEVLRRQEQGIHSLTEALSDEPHQLKPPEPPPVDAEPPCSHGDLRETEYQPGAEKVEHALRECSEQLMDERPEQVRQRFPELFEWREQVKPVEAYERGTWEERFRN